MSEKSKSGIPDSESSSLERDISNKKLSEQIKNNYADLIDSLPIVVYVAESSPPYAPIHVSKGVEMLGYTQKEWNADADLWMKILHEDDRERVLRETETVIQEGRENDYEYRVYARDGSVRWLHNKGHFVRDESGQPVSWQGFLIDITKRRLRNQEEPLSEVGKNNNQPFSKTILLVEDEEIIREMVSHILLSNGYKVMTAKNGSEALRICESGSVFDMVITDFNMPQMNGRELADKIRALCGNVKILYISGYSDDPKFLDSIAASKKNFLAKPFSPETLLAKTKEIMEEN